MLCDSLMVQCSLTKPLARNFYWGRDSFGQNVDVFGKIVDLFYKTVDLLNVIEDIFSKIMAF